MVTLVVIRVVYVNDVAVSISVPTDTFTGDTAAIDASAYVRKNVRAPADKDIRNRVEYQVLPTNSKEGAGAARLDRWSSLPPAPNECPSDEEHSHVRLISAKSLRRQGSR